MRRNHNGKREITRSLKRKRVEEEDLDYNPNPNSTDRTFRSDITHSPSKKSKFRLNYLFAKGDVVPIPCDKDTLHLQKAFRSTQGYYTPSKVSIVYVDNDTPFLITKTSRKRTFKKVAKIKAVQKKLFSSFNFYQEPGNAEKKEKKYPPVIRKTPKQVEADVIPPKSNKKVVKETFVTEAIIRKARRKPRKQPKRFFHDTSANEINNVHGANGKKLRHALSHVCAVGQGGKDNRENIVVAPEGHNIKRMNAVENPASQVIFDEDMKLDGLYYSATIDLVLDKHGKPTHVGKNEVSCWKSPGKTSSVEIHLNAQNKERSTVTLGDMAKVTFFRTFDSSGSSDSDSSLVSSDFDEEETFSSSF